MPVVRFDGATLIRVEGRFASAATELTFATRLAFDDLTRNQWLFAPPIAAGPDGGIFRLHTSWLPFWSVNLTTLGIASGDAFSLMLSIDTTGGLSGGRTGKLWINGAEAATQSGVGSGSENLSGIEVFGYTWSASICPTVEVTDWVWLADTALDPALHWADFFGPDQLPRALAPGGAVGGVAPGLYIRGDAARWNSGVDENGHAYTVAAPFGTTGGVVLDVGGGDAEHVGGILAATAVPVGGAARGGATGSGAILTTSVTATAGMANGGASVAGRIVTATAAPTGATTEARGSAAVAGRTLLREVSLAAGFAGGDAVGDGRAVAAIASALAGLASTVRSPIVPGRLLATATSPLPGRAASTSFGKREQVLRALFAALEVTAPSGTAVLRNAVLPERVPGPGLLILRDGNPGDPSFIFSPPRWFYEHRAEIDLVVDGATPATRDAAFDRMLRIVAEALAVDRTLGGLVDFAVGEAPVPLDLAVDGANGLKAATIGVILSYDTGDPLG